MSSGRAERACEKYREWAGGANPGLCGNCAWPKDLHGVKPVVVIADSSVAGAIHAMQRQAVDPFVVQAALAQHFSQKEEVKVQAGRAAQKFTRQQRRKLERDAAKAARRQHGPRRF